MKVSVRGNPLGVSDLELAAADPELGSLVRQSRTLIRDRENGMTWFHDRLLGFTPSAVVRSL